MTNPTKSPPQGAISRKGFLLALALIITVLFYWLINDFFITLLLAAILAALADPFNTRLTKFLKGRQQLAAGTTVVLCLIMVIVPLLLFLGVLVEQAVEISHSANDWVASQTDDSGHLKQELQDAPIFKRLLPYQDEIVAKMGQITARAGTYVAKGLAVGAKTTASLFLQLFILLFAMFSFLMIGRSLLNEVLRFTPLKDEDQSRLLSIFASVGRATIKGTLVIGIIQGGLAGLSFAVAGVGGAVFWGAVMAVMSIVPGIGTAIVWVPTVIYMFLNGQQGAAIGVALWCGIVVGSADNVLRPLLIGKDIQMPNLLVMLTTLGGLVMIGPTGIIVGPIVGALYITVWQIWAGVMDEEAAAAAAPAED